MIYFNNDYSEGCLPEILNKMIKTNMEQTPGYGMDFHCAAAADKIRSICENKNAGVHFLVGGTQTNLTIIAAALRPYQAVISAVSGHINVHETGAIEATGHKVVGLQSADGKITAQQVLAEVQAHYSVSDAEHCTQPGMVYISNPTEYGTIYTLKELEALSKVCKANGLYLFADGARLGYGLTAEDNDVTLSDMARLCDVFYIGGTKVGALFGEAVIISNPVLDRDFRYMIKQRGAMLAKGRLLGIQFETLFENDAYFKIATKANAQAQTIRNTLKKLGCRFLVDNTTNQLFPILPNKALNALNKEFCFSDMGRVDDEHRAVRICTSWATCDENVQMLCDRLEIVLKSLQS